MHWELWDIETANLVGTFDTEGAGLAVVRELVGKGWPMDALSLMVEDEAVPTENLPPGVTGAELAEARRPDRVGRDPTDRLTPEPVRPVSLQSPARGEHQTNERFGTDVPLWAQILGLVLLIAFVGLSVEAYFGPGLRTRLGLGGSAPADTVPARVFYEPGATARAGQKSIGSEGRERTLLEGDAVLLGATGQVVRLGPGGRTTDLAAREGAITTVVNLGAWEGGTGRLSGATARVERSRWLLDDLPLQSAGAALHPPNAPAEDLTAGFTLGPEGDAGRVRRVSDREGPAVRFGASRKAPLFSLDSRQPITTLDGVLVSISAVVRGQPGKTIVLSLRDVTDASGTAETVADRRPTSEEWTTLTVHRHVAYPSPGDSFSVGILDADGGDWFEVRDVKVVLGVAP